MNTTHTSKMNNAKSMMMGALIGWASKALRGLLLRMDATVAEKAEATPVPTKNSAAVPERKCAAAGNAQPHRKHANAKNRPWHPRASRPRLQVNRKPTYRPVASGATFLVDTANLIGAIGPEHAAARPLAPARRAGLKGCVDARLAADDGRTAVKLLARAARKDPSVYAEMSRIYEEGDGLAADARTAKRYARLAKKEMKVARQTARRQKRLVANCVTGLDLANLRGAEDLLLAQKLEQCAQRKAEGRKFLRSASHKRTGHAARAFRYAA